MLFEDELVLFDVICVIGSLLCVVVWFGKVLLMVLYVVC